MREMDGSTLVSVWVFNGERSAFPGGVFATRDAAHAWISRHALSGVLTEYPLGVGVLEWAVENGFFRATREQHADAGFIARFTSSRQTHVHYENGIQV